MTEDGTVFLSQKTRLEAGLPTSRGLQRYEQQLGFSRSLLVGKDVLNVGSGQSDLGNDLSGTNLVDIDLNPGHI